MAQPCLIAWIKSNQVQLKFGQPLGPTGTVSEYTAGNPPYVQLNNRGWANMHVPRVSAQVHHGTWWSLLVSVDLAVFSVKVRLVCVMFYFAIFLAKRWWVETIIQHNNNFFFNSCSSLFCIIVKWIYLSFRLLVGQIKQWGVRKLVLFVYSVLTLRRPNY